MLDTNNNEVHTETPRNIAADSGVTSETSESGGEREPHPTMPGRDAKGRLLPGHKAGGRPPGKRNKFTELKDAFVDVFYSLNETERRKHLLRFAKEDPKTFYTLMSKLFPTRHELSGPDGRPMERRDASEWSEEELLAILEARDEGA